jgi:hypothetical protein
MHRSLSGLINGSDFLNLYFIAGVCIEDLSNSSDSEPAKNCRVFRSSMVRINKRLKHEPGYLSTVTGWMVGIQFLAGARDFFLLSSGQNSSGAHPASDAMGTKGSFPDGKVASTVFARSNTGVMGSNPTQDLEVCAFFVWVAALWQVHLLFEECYRLCIGLQNWKSSQGWAKCCGAIDEWMKVARVWSWPLTSI